MPYLGRRTVADVIRAYRDDQSVREQSGPEDIGHARGSHDERRR